MHLIGFYLLALYANWGAALHLDPQSVLSVKVSSKGITRVSLKGEGIKDIFFYPDVVKESIFLHQSGDVFIAPCEHSFSLTLIGSRGTKQDLSITFGSTTPKPLILEDKPSEKPLDDASLGRLLLSFHTKKPEELAQEYTPGVFEELKITLAPSITFQTIGAYSSSSVTIFKGQVDNKSHQPFTLKSTDFPFAHLVSFESEVIQPHRSSTLYFIKKGKFL